MKRVCLLILLFNSFTIWSQNCVHTKLSYKYDFITKISRLDNRYKTAQDSCTININIADKITGKESLLLFFCSNYSHSMLDDVYLDCNNVRSYSTGYNKNADIIDNDYGDLIVADFNFDEIEDVAVKIHCGGNGGPIYTFLLQSKTGGFNPFNYLSDIMGYFPHEINPEKRELITLVHANSTQLNKTTYQLSENGNWEKTKEELVPYDFDQKN